MNLIALLDRISPAFKKQRAKTAMKKAIQGITLCFQDTLEGFSFEPEKSFEACFEEAKAYFTATATFCVQQHKMVEEAQQKYEEHRAAFTDAAEILATSEIKQIEISFANTNPRVRALFANHYSCHQQKVLDDSLPASKKSKKLTV